MTEEVSEEQRYEALYESIREGNRDDLKALIQKESKAGIEVLDCNKWPPILEAAAYGQTDILWELVHEYGFDTLSFELEPYYEEIYGSGNERKEEHSLCRGTALTVALEAGHWATAAFLITEGADVNAMFYGISAQTYESFGYEISTDEGTCLYLALVNQAPSRIIELMQTNGLDVDQAWGKSNEEDTLLGIAIRDKKPELVSKLLELGADPNQTVRIPNEVHLHTLCFIIHHYVSSEPAWLEIISLLLKHGADNDYEADEEDEDYDDTFHNDVYKAALDHGDGELIKSLGLMERVVSNLKEAQKIKARQEERENDLRYSPPELVINLWAICDVVTGVVYNILGRAYNVQGSDAEKLEFLHRLARHDYINAERQPLDPRFVIVHPDGNEIRGATFIDAIHDPQSGIFEHLFDYLDSKLPKKPIFPHEGVIEAPQRIPEDPLCVRTILCEADTGEIRAMITDEDRDWAAQYSDSLTIK